MREAKANLRVLVVEDDERMLDLLCRGLRDFGHTAMPARDGAAGFDLAMVCAFDVVVLDVALPILDGCQVARTLREKRRAVPILMLTARDAEDDIIRGLQAGADDYLLKPFSFPELVARLHMLSRTAAQRSGNLGLRLDPSRLAATRGLTSIPLTRTEFSLLSVLHGRAGTAVSRQALIETIWQEQGTNKANALDVLINALRNKVDGPFPHKLIETIRGFGYRLRPEADSTTSGESSPGAVASVDILQRLDA